MTDQIDGFAKLDGYLSQKAQEIDPSALVWRTTSDHWVLRRNGHPDFGLGVRADSSFGEAQQALSAWIRAQRATRA